MNTELLNVLDHIEREKGIKREVLIQAVEAALVSAARKAIDKKLTGEISVKIDSGSGQIKVFCDNKEVTTAEFGRIAAQTAKQVIIQKIREAERDVIYEEFLKQIGGIISGLVHRFERGGIVVDLGKVEAVLPRSEQLPREEYKQGDRIRAYILDVKRTGRGPQIVLSRRHSGLVKHLFELEVPEIYEGIVEIKAIAREAGERTKIAVCSHDEKVDSVGACVGMRGSRVKNVIRELRGEKVDIIRWSENIVEYITAALSPAEIVEVKVNQDKQSVEVIVDDDQLSLAIGKRGQNVRLACKLTTWDIDIRSKSVILARKEIPLTQLDGVGKKTEKALKEAGFKDIAFIARSKLDSLVKVEGIGKKTAEKILGAAKKIINSTKL